jgi:hypothetical protein
MKVLYLSGATGADYECDMIMHGLRTLLGPDLVDVNRLDFMYQNWPHPPFYSIYSLLPDIPVDRDDIQAKISRHYFDLIIYGSIHRYRQHWELVRTLYPANRIVFIDGEDDHSVVDFVGAGIYFKRELTDQHHSAILPIQFCIPKEKIRPIDLSRKTRLMSPLIPGDTSTYIYYGDESKYYDQYSESYFGRTKKKGGWDCCRHYEIMAAGALPYFENLEECPSKTLYWLPKDRLMIARNLYENWTDNCEDEWQSDMESVRRMLLSCLTTEAMAKYVLDTVSAS